MPGRTLIELLNSICKDKKHSESSLTEKMHNREETMGQMAADVSYETKEDRK